MISEISLTFYVFFSCDILVLVIIIIRVRNFISIRKISDLKDITFYNSQKKIKILLYGNFDIFKEKYHYIFYQEPIKCFLFTRHIRVRNECSFIIIY